MSLTFKQAQQNIYLDGATEVEFDSQKKYNIILSPHLYWVKKLSLPLKSAKEVKKVAHTLFEDSLPEDVSYSYEAYKKGEEFFVFAYNDAEILALLEEKGITSANIAAIYFAQSELDALEGAYRVNDTEALQVKEGVVVLLPSEWFDTLKTLDIDALKPSKHRLKLQHFNNVIEKSSLNKIMIVLALFIVVLITELFIYKHQVTMLTEEKENVFGKYQLKPTMMQNRAILEHYTRKNAQQKKLRLALLSLLQSHLKSSQKIKSIVYGDALLKVTVSNVSAQEKNRIIALLHQKGIDFTTNLKGANLVVEVKL